MSRPAELTALCRDCAAAIPAGMRMCPHCRSRRLLQHPELHALQIAHLDLDSFFASVEIRDQPSLAGKPVAVGSEHRGVVAAASYVARMHGVRSAMPMFRALELCPDLVVVRPNMRKYSTVGGQVRDMMLELTPLVEPISIDEAYLDLSGTERLHGMSPAQCLAKLLRRIEREVGVTASVGLSYNKFLAKIASDLDKPRGFAVIGQAEACDVLAPMAVSTIWGVGPATAERLRGDGIITIADLRERDEYSLLKRYGVLGRQLHRFAHGRDDRPVQPGEEAKSVSNETTFEADLSALDALRRELWPLVEKVSQRMAKDEVLGRLVVLKLKTAEHKSFTRSKRLPAPSGSAEDIWLAAVELLEREADGRRYRLIGVGCSDLLDRSAPPDPDLFTVQLPPQATAPVSIEPPSPSARPIAQRDLLGDLVSVTRAKRRKIESAVGSLRSRFGQKAIGKGRGLGTPQDD